MNKISKSILSILSVLALTQAALAAVHYVYSSASGTNDGSNWTNAYTSLQSALTAATSGDEIWVAKGTYYPSSAYSLTNTSRYYHFEMINGVTLYGGFAGTESAVSERTSYGSGETNETTLSGDIGAVGDNSDNCYHVFYHREDISLNNTAILDGFTLSEGNANGGAQHNSGGGMYNYNNSPRIRNCVFIDNSANYGGGGLCNATDSPVLVETCRFISNTAQYGGGVYNSGATSTLINCVFNGNSASDQGGGMYNYGNNAVTVTNCLFYQNNAGSGYGGAAYNYSAGPVYNNCTFTENTAGYGGGVSNYNGAVQTYNNCIFWGNSATSNGDEIYIAGGTSTLNYSCYQNEEGDIFGTPTASNCISADPQFVGVLNNSDHPYSIGGISPCCDTGNDGYCSETVDIRGSGFSRKLDKTTGETGTIDMGAYEYQPGVDTPLPIALTSFTATFLNGAVQLTWHTATETDNAHFLIYRNDDVITTIEGAGTTSEPHNYEYIDNQVIPGNTYIYVLADISYANEETKYTNKAVTINIPENDIPTEFALEDNIPNPFNPITTFNYTLPEAQNVNITIYDITGRQIETLISRYQTAGSYSLKWDASNYSSGVYFYRLQTGSFTSTKKMILMK